MNQPPRGVLIFPASLALFLAGAGLLVCLLPAGSDGAAVTAARGDSVLWWVMQGAIVCWALLVLAAGWRRMRVHLLFACLLAVLALNYVAFRPGGWYAQAKPAPAFAYWPGDDGFCDASFYWKSAIDHREGTGNPFLTNWYPPPFLQAFSLLTALPPDRAFAIWWLVVCGSYFACVILTYRVLLEWKHPPTAAGLFTALLWIHNRPAIQTSADLQVNLLVLALLLLGYLGVAGKGFLSGAAVGLATFIKVIPLVVLPFMGLARRFRWLTASLAAMAVVAGLSFLGDGATLWSRFLEALPSRRWSSDSFEGTLVRFLAPAVAVPLACVAKAAVLVWGATIVLSHRHAADAAGERTVLLSRAAFAVGAVCMVLVSPAIWPHHRVWFVPALLFGWSHCRPELSPALLLATFALLWLPTLPFVGLLGIVIPALLLLWCLRPRNTVPDPADGALAAGVRRIGERIRAG